MHSAPEGGKDWLTPATQQPPLRRFLRVIRDRWLLIAAVTLLAVGAAIAYVAVAPKTYVASADMLVTPVSNDDQRTLGLSLIRSSIDPTRDVSTAARLVLNTGVAKRVKERLELESSPEEVLARVDAVPVAQSSLINVTASGASATEAARLANAFAIETVALRTEKMHEQLDALIVQLRRRFAALGPEDRAQTDLQARLSSLLALRGVPDPTIRVANQALPPDRAASPKPRLSIAAGIIAGLLLGFGAAFALESLDPRLRREEQLRELYSLPVLARIAQEKSRKGQLMLPGRVSAATAEAFRTLRATLLVTKQHSTGRGRSVLITGSGASEGKSSTALNFAAAVAQTGQRVILVEADLYRPTLAGAIGVRPTYGVEQVLLGQATVEDALVTDAAYGPNLRFLLVGATGPDIFDRLALPTARELIPQAERLADFVIIDSPPATDVGDVLPMAAQATDVLIVARLGRSRLPRMRELGEILGQNGVRPAGVVLIGVTKRESSYYYVPPAATSSDDRRSREPVSAN